MTIKALMNKTLTLLVAGAALASQTVRAQQSGALQDAERMIARCMDYATSQKYPPLSVGVYDPLGEPIAFKRQDGASASTAEAAQLKARTAMRVAAPTALLADVDQSTRDALLVMRMTTLAGGVPLVDDKGRPSGAVGVSGGTTEQDAECARRAAELVSAKK